MPTDVSHLLFLKRDTSFVPSVPSLRTHGIGSRRGTSDQIESHASKTIRVAPGSELDRLLESIADTPVELERDGVHYRLDRVNRPSGEAGLSDDRIARSIAGIRKAAGAWDDIDAEEFKAYIRERRRTANRPSVDL